MRPVRLENEGLQDGVEIVTHPFRGSALLVDGPAQHRSVDHRFDSARQLPRIGIRRQFLRVDRVLDELLELEPGRACVLDEVPPEIGVGEIDLEVREVAREREIGRASCRERVCLLV